MQCEVPGTPVKTCNLYALVRAFQTKGFTCVKISHHEAKRPETRSPGDRDVLEIACTSKFDFVLKKVRRVDQWGVLGFEFATACKMSNFANNGPFLLVFSPTASPRPLSRHLPLLCLCLF